jgi:hypothetical protein
MMWQDGDGRPVGSSRCRRLEVGELAEEISCVFEDAYKHKLDMRQAACS